MWHLERRQHPFQRGVLVDIAGKDFASAHEAAAIEHQPQGQERAVAALLLRVTAPRLGLLRRDALEERVGQVDQGDRVLETEQVAHRLEQVVLDRPAMGHQGIRGTVEPHHAHGLEVRVQQLAKGAALAQPAPGGALRSRRRHAADDRSHGRGAQRTVEAQPLQEFAKSELLHGPQPGLFDAHRARPHHLQGVHIHAVHLAARGPRTIRRAADKLRRDALRLAFHHLGTCQRQHRGLARQKL